jgi:prepilin-type N-terminal cleavage/methylation domain-containing protein
LSSRAQRGISLRALGRAAFTLIELLAAVTILVIIVTIMGRIFTESDRAWTLGTIRSDNNLAGRAALSMIAHDLQYAVADKTLTFIAQKDRYSLTSYGFENDETCFVSIENDSSDGNRAAREVFYYVRENPAGSKRYELMRGYYSSALSDAASASSHCYFNPNWYKNTADGGVGRPGTSRFIAKNVAGFAVFARKPNGQLIRDYYSGTPAYTNRLPGYVDVCIELLNDRDARQAADLQLRGLSYTNFVADRVVRHVARVYFTNRDGYKER